MIDWLSMNGVPLAHDRRLFSGRVMCVTPDGEIEWQSDRWLAVEGSHDARVHIRTSPQFPGACVDVSGNPAKFLQGHNLFGSDDLQGLAIETLEKLSGILGIVPRALDRSVWACGRVSLSRADINYSFATGSRPRARNALRAVEQHGFLAHRGRGNLMKGGTLYYGKNSRRWSLKLYVKADEIEAPQHRLPRELAEIPALTDWVEDKLRVEIVLRSMQLKELQLDTIGAWSDTTAAQLFQLYLGKLQISDAAMIAPDVLGTLPPRLQAAYQLWRDGHDLREMFPHRTFYRYRAQLLEHGIDIALKQEREQSNVVPLRVVLHAQPAPVPSWAHGTKLLFEPRAQAAAA